MDNKNKYLLVKAIPHLKEQPLLKSMPKFTLNLKMKVRYKIGESIAEGIDEGDASWKTYVTECIHDTLVCKPVTVIYNPSLVEEEDHYIQIEVKVGEKKIEELVDFLEFKVKIFGGS